MNKVRQWSMLTAVAVVVIVAAGWFLLVSSQNHKAAGLRAQASSVQGKNSSLQLQVTQLQQQKTGLPAQQRKLAKYAEQIPDNPALPTLIRQLTSAAHDAGVDLISMSPSAPAAVSPTAAVAPATTSAGAPAAALDQISLSLTLKGSYYNVENFFASLEKLRRATMVTQWSLTPETEGASGSSSSSSGSSTSGTTAAPADPPGTISATLTGLVFESPAVTPVAPAPAN